MGPRRYNRLNRADMSGNLQTAGSYGPADAANEFLNGATACGKYIIQREEAFGQLVALGFDVTAFTPVPYRRPRLGRPSMEISSCGRLRA